MARDICGEVNPEKTEACPKYKGHRSPHGWTARRFAYEIGIDNDDGSEKILEGGFLDAFNQNDAENKVSGIANRKYPRADWWHHVQEVPA